jgi:hypothetical protein
VLVGLIIMSVSLIVVLVSQIIVFIGSIIQFIIEFIDIAVKIIATAKLNTECCLLTSKQVSRNNKTFCKKRKTG